MGDSFSLNSASAYSGLSRAFLRRLVNGKLVRGSYADAVNRWQLDKSSLDAYLEANGLQPAIRPRVAIVVVGAPADWFTDFAGRLPAGHSASHAAALFDAGRQLELSRPTVAVVDFAMGRSEALDLGRRLSACRVRCVALANEDEGDVIALSQAGYSAAIKKPVNPAAVIEVL